MSANGNLEKDLAAVFGSLFENFGKDKGASKVKELVEYFEEAIRANRNKIEPDSEVLITRSFLDAKPEV